MKHEGCGFGSEGEGAGQFSGPVGIAVQQQGGDVYLVDTRNERAEHFSGEGVFRSTWGWGVSDGSTHALQICEIQCFGGLAGSGAGQFGERPEGVAVDNSFGLSRGDVYVADPQNLRVEKFSPSGEFILMFGGEVNETEDNTPSATAAERNVCTAASGDICKAGVASPEPGAFEGLEQAPLAVDAAGTVYVGDRERVQQFNASGNAVGALTLPAGSGFVNALAVDAKKDLYVAMSSAEVNGVHKFAGCSGNCTGVELGSPRDSGGGVQRLVAVGLGDELFVDDPEVGRVFGFSAGGVQLLSLAEVGGGGGIAFGVEANVLYVLHPGEVRALSLPPAGPVVQPGSESVDEVLPVSVRLHALVNPEGPEATETHFEYGTSTGYGSSTPSEGLVGEPFEDHAVSAVVSGLLPRTTYHFRAVVSNAGSQTTFGPDQTFTTLPPVGIDSESVSQVTSSSARLATELNPHGLATEYHFEYGTSTSYGTVVPVPDADAGAGTTDTAFGIVIENLTPGTVYHYRVVAHNTLGTEEGPDRSFSTQPPETPGLLDGRAWELVSPPNKHGVSLEALAYEGGPIQAAEDGSGLAYIAKAPVDSEPPGNRSISNTQLLAKRDQPGAWSTKDITTPHEEVTGLTTGNLSEYKQLSGDLSREFVEPFGATPLSAQATERTPYLREAGSSSFVPLAYPGNVAVGTKFGGEEVAAGLFSRGVTFVTSSPDGAHALLSSPTALTPGFTSNEQTSLFEWTAGHLQLVSVLPNNIPAAEEGTSALAGNSNKQVRGAISADGNRIVFEASPGGGRLHLFMRDLVRGESLELDAPAAGARVGGGSPIFQFASADGRRVFFKDEAKLTVGAGAREGAPDLYECEIAVLAGHLACSLRDLSVSLNAGEAGGVLGAVSGGDSAGRFLYFAANSVLAPGGVKGECLIGNPNQQPAGSLCNLYVVDTESGVVRLVAVVSARDGVDWDAEHGGTNLGSLSGGASSNGRWFTFMSERSLTGFDNRDVVSGVPAVEVYLYDAVSGGLRCVSCAASGARPHALFEKEEFPGPLVDRQQAWAGQWLAGLVPGWTRVDLGHALYDSRFLSDSGRLFFDSPVGLVAGDGNGKMDVYEFEPEGVGACTSSSRFYDGSKGGCTSLVSSGSSSEESAFLDASTSGEDVFFMTSAKLSPSDTDGSFDIYDAHVCTISVPCAPPAPVYPPPCTTEASCKTAPAAKPAIFGAPASSSFSGPGNPPIAEPRKKTSKLKTTVRTRAQRLSRALKACANKPKRLRSSCKSQVRKRYGLHARPKGNAPEKLSVAVGKTKRKLSASHVNGRLGRERAIKHKKHGVEK